MKVCRFQVKDEPPRVGVTRDDQTLIDLASVGIERPADLFELEDPGQHLNELIESTLAAHLLKRVKVLPFLDHQEVWAAGVTYQRSKKARMDESTFSATAYDRVYEAERPELFFKSMPSKVVFHGDTVGIRRDARWSVPEPELALVLSAKGKVVGYTIGNDMSSRDIEGENLLYLPQAKVYNRSCALSPWVKMGVTEAEARAWTIHLEIHRDGQPAFAGETSVGQIKRSFDDLAQFLFRSQTFAEGAVLLTGTGIVPADDFSLRAGDQVRITISGIGTLENSVVEV
jgi:2-dehydro-3-deoxy-D-arabinonate dehydratase